jgi:hypothetical protein
MIIKTYIYTMKISVKIKLTTYLQKTVVFVKVVLVIPVDNNTSILDKIDELISNAVVIKRNERSKFIPIMKTIITCNNYAIVILVINMIFYHEFINPL